MTPTERRTLVAIGGSLFWEPNKDGSDAADVLALLSAGLIQPIVQSHLQGYALTPARFAWGNPRTMEVLMADQVVRISNEVEIPYLTYSGQPVLTFNLIDKVHNRVDGTAGRNFRANRKRFIESEDFFYVIDSESLNEFRRSHPGILKDAANEITLITESGYLMLVKSFTDDLSWQIQRQLVKLYFRAMELAQQQRASSTAQEAPELVSGNDMRNLSRLVWLMTHQFRSKNAFVQAVWHALRAYVGVPSPQRFQVRHIPVLASEVRRIYGITRALAELIAEAEQTVIRRILRHGENAEKVLAETRALLAQSAADDLQEANDCLQRWSEQEIARFVERRPIGGNVHYPDAVEPGLNL